MASTATTAEKTMAAAELKSAMPQILMNGDSFAKSYLKKWQAARPDTQATALATFVEAILNEIEGWSCI